MCIDLWKFFDNCFEALRDYSNVFSSVYIIAYLWVHQVIHQSQFFGHWPIYVYCWLLYWVLWACTEDCLWWISRMISVACFRFSLEKRKKSSTVYIPGNLSWNVCTDKLSYVVHDKHRYPWGWIKLLFAAKILISSSPNACVTNNMLYKIISNSHTRSWLLLTT